MSPQRADATHIAPYLTHLITHHGQVTLVPADNNGRRRKGRQDYHQFPRNGPREEPVRFNSGPTIPGSLASSSARILRRTQRNSRSDEQYLDDIPNYPPPSFQEAMLSPPVSVCPSTTTLALSATPQVSRHESDSGSDSDDDASLDIVEQRGVIPTRGPTTESGHSQIQTPPRGRGILDSDPDDTGYAPSSLNPRPHRRHLSLSPLRTLFPSRNSIRDSGDALSVQSTPLPHSLPFARNSTFSRSTTSLRNLTSPSAPLPPSSPASAPSVRSESFLNSRRLFSHKGKERAHTEALDSWEMVTAEPELESPATPTLTIGPQSLVAEPGSPVQATPTDTAPPRSPVSPTSTAAPHPLSERDRLAKLKSRVPHIIPSHLREQRERRVPPSPPSAPPLAPGEGPPIVTVRTKKPPPPPPPKRKPQPAPSPLGGIAESLADLDLERAVQTPLPLTPVTGSPTSPFVLPAELAAEPPNHKPIFFPASPSSSRGAEDRDVEPPKKPIFFPASPSSSRGTEDGNSSVDADEQNHPHPHHHYPWRPLPRRPRVAVDSTFAPHPDFPQTNVVQRPPPSVPEGLLIDLDPAETPTAETPTAQIPESLSVIESVSTELTQLAPPVAEEMNRTSSESSVYLAPTSSPEFLDITDLDLLLARLENDQHDGANYDTLLMVSELIGQATPTRATSGPSPAVKVSALLTGPVEVQRRRVTRDGRVKLKLVLLGVAVDRCGICMSQFKKAERGRLSERCKHAFHERCLSRWLVRSRTCPLCRVALDVYAASEVEGCRSDIR